MPDVSESTAWMDEPIGSFPWNEGELMELPHGPHLYYLRVTKVNESGIAVRTRLIGGVANGNFEYGS